MTTHVVLGGIVTVGSRTLAPSVYAITPALAGVLNVTYGGPGAIAGIVTQQGVPARKQVSLLAYPEMDRVAATFGAADGAYSFERLRVRRYLILAIDETDTYNPEAKIVTPV